MSVEQQVDALTASVEDLKGAVVSKKATLDASVFDAQSATAQAQAAKVNALSARDQAGAFKDAAYGAAQSAASAVAYQDLSAVAQTKAVTAVDVFIYDTSQDTDGGAWRHRCAGTSWYREPLNTATRGMRREFPTVAVIVAEASKITIYDGDDPDLPMWMVFNGGASGSGLMPLIAGGYPITSIFAANAEICAAHGTGLFRCNFVSDSGLNHEGSPYSPTRFTTNIAQRSAAAFVVDNTLPQIVNRAAKDVAITVLPEAPIDHATRLPVQTIAVATAGGVSVIKDDGTVVSGDIGKSILTVGFDDRSLFWTTGSVGYWAMYTALDRLNSGLSISPYENSIFATSQGNTGYPKIPAAGAIDRLISDGETGLIAADMNLGLSRLTAGDGYKNTTSRNDRMLLQTTSLFTTGWLPGDIRGAFLADTGSTSLVEGDNLIAGLFSPDRDLSGSGEWREIISQASVSEGILTILHDHTSSPTGRVVSGTDLLHHSKTYRCRWTVDDFVGDANGSSVAIGTDGSGNGGTSSGVKYGVGSFEALISVPVGSSNRRVALFANGGNPIGAVAGAKFSAFTVEEVVSDRSVNNKGLIVNGTITRAPVATGAELVAYSGFSGANFLEQPYNAGLNFGTGDFCIMGWSQFTNLGTWQGLFSRTNRQEASAGSTDTMYARLTDQGRLGFYLWTGSATTSQTISDVVPIGPWVFWALVRRNGTLQWLINGVPSGAAVNDGTDVSNVTDGTEALLIGREYFDGGGFAAGNTSFALFRIGANAPAAHQIRRIYEDEKALFQENAACTIYGTSDAVTALAQDPDTGLLHVGTSAGRSVFKGLRRVANTTTPVSAAIAAAGGMVIDA